MDIKLFSEIIKELLRSNEKVTLPGLGCFVVEDVPASFSDKGFTINPPYRKVCFRPLREPDTVLVDFYAKANNTDKSRAGSVIDSFVKDLRESVYSKKNVVLPGFGRLRATRENNVFFIQDESLDLFPQYDCLESVSLKSLTDGAASGAEQPHVPDAVPAPESVAEQVPEQEPIVDPQPAFQPEPQPEPQQEFRSELQPEPQSEPQPEPQPEPQSEPQPEPQPEQQSEPQQESPSEPRKERKGLPWWAVAIIVVLSVAIVALAALAVVGRLNPELVDPLLYSPEELEILNYRL